MMDSLSKLGVCFQLARAAACIASVGSAAPVLAQDAYPSRPVKVIINSSPGGLTDVVGRLVTTKMGQALGQQFVVENRSGAPVVGADALAKAAPDGYTIGVLGNSLSALPAMNPNLPFSPTKDLVPIALLNSSQLVLVTATRSPYRSVADFVAEAKAKPSQLAFASGGNATMGHLLAEQLQASAGISLVHVPYKGGAPAMADLLAGHVPVFFDTVGTTVPLAREGKVRALAVAGSRRSTVLPDVPTLAEAGYADVQGTGWFAMFAPARTPPEIVVRLNAEANKALQSPDVKERLQSLGTNVEGGSPGVLADLLGTEIPRWTKLIRDRNINTN